jgi:rSAM/selenodomain-associated transferase 1
MASRAGARPRITFAPRLVIMAKSPRAGFAKRRLGRELGNASAMRLYRTWLAHTVLRLAADTRWHTVLAVAPDKDATAHFWAMRQRLEALPQGHGDLGVRLQRLFARLGPGPVIVVGSDIPSLRPAHVARAFKLLARADAVFGPAQDGGYWLVGMRRRPRVLAPFAGVRWSSAHALADTVASLQGKSIAFAETLGDIDTAEAFREQRDIAERLLPLVASSRILAARRS